MAQNLNSCCTRSKISTEVNPTDLYGHTKKKKGVEIKNQTIEGVAG